MNLRLVQAAVCAGAMAPWLAGGDPLATDVVTERPQSVRLLKAPGDSLRFHWMARVGEPGHFVLERPDGSQVWTAAVVGRSAYHAAPPALSGEYELRYRDAAGHERVLAHVLVACMSIDPGTPASIVSRAVTPDALAAPSSEAPARSTHGRVRVEADRWPAGSLRPPPTPPPRSRA